MASNVTMPKMGYDMEEGKILKWLKQEGDTVTKGEPIAEIETKIASLAGAVQQLRAATQQSAATDNDDKRGAPTGPGGEDVVDAEFEDVDNNQPHRHAS